MAKSQYGDHQGRHAEQAKTASPSVLCLAMSATDRINVGFGGRIGERLAVISVSLTKAFAQDVTDDVEHQGNQQQRQAGGKIV